MNKVDCLLKNPCHVLKMKEKIDEFQQLMMTTRAASAEPCGSTPEVHESPKKQDSRNLESALRFFKNLDLTTSLRGNIKLHLAVEEIVKHSMSQGLQPSHITALVDIIVSSNHKLSQTIRSKFVKCLIPSSKVPQAAIVRVLSHVSSKIFNSPGPSNLHSLLLRWILLVFDYIDGYDQLHKLYGVVFCFINSHRLLPHACHLLFLLTTKSDVRLFRVQKLLELIKSLGPEPYVMGLLMIYKVYCPHLVSMKLEFGYKVFFKAHDAAWRSTIAAVVKQREDTLDIQAHHTASEIRSRRDRANIQPRSKRQKLMIPEPHSAFHEVEEEVGVGVEDLLQNTGSIPYTQVESFTGFLEAVDKIEYPSQIAACLSEPRLQLLLTCNPDPLVMTRLCFWIQHIFAFGFKGTGKDSSERNEKLLEMLFTLSKNVEGLPVVFGFLESFLPTWDGQSYVPLIFSLITCLRPCPYNELHCSILEPLQRLFFTSDVYGKTMCIAALTKLMRNFALDERSCSVAEADRTSCVPQLRQEPQSREAGGVAGDTEQEEVSQGQHVVLNNGNTLDTMYRLINFLDVVIVLGLRVEDDHYLLQMSSLDLLQLISEMYLKYHIHLVCLPMRVIHRLLLSDCALTLARLCGSINVFREAFVKLKSSRQKQSGVSMTCATTGDLSYAADNSGTDKFNALLLDVLGMLWQGRLFTDGKHKYESIFRFHRPSHLEGKLKDNALTIYRGPAFIGLAYKFLKETQREGKRVHPQQIQEFKETYLQFLVREGFPEFMHLVNTNIKRRQNQN